MLPFDKMPYTNFHELNLAYFIVHFREIFAEWETLYNNMVAWREQTNESLELWKTDTLNAIEDYERDLTDAWDAWKAETALDITDWKNETLDALDAWKTAFQTLFDSTFSNLSQIKTDAEAARDAAIAAQNRAETAAATLVLDPTLTSATQAAQAKAVGDAVDDLKSALSSIATFPELIYTKSDCETSYDSTYKNNGYISETGSFTESDDYRTYYKTFDSNSSIYATRTPDSGYFSIAVFSGSPSTSTFVARYRSADGNLPTEQHRASVGSGYVIAISRGYSSSEDRDFYLYSGFKSFTGHPTETFAQEVLEYQKVGKATKTADSLTIYIDTLKYEINKYNDSSTRAYMWRSNACRVLDENGAYHTIWADSDSDGIVKISGESDFVGGYHGDETENLFHLFVDGVEYAESSTFENKPFNEIVLYVESNVYHCNTSQTPDVVAFKRNKTITFNNEGYTVENYWTAQENLTCEIAYIGMLSVENNLINGYHTNYDFKYRALGDSGAGRQANMTDVCFTTPYGDIGVKVSEAIPNANYGCVVSKYTGRIKVYASTFNSSSQGALNVGDVIKGKAITYFRG